MKSVRDGKRVWPYCSECGCRLAIDKNNFYTVDGYHLLNHWSGIGWHEDARGHTCPKFYRTWLIEHGKLSYLGGVFV